MQAQRKDLQTELRNHSNAESICTFILILKVLALLASKFKNTNGTDYANSWLRSRYNQ